MEEGFCSVLLIARFIAPFLVSSSEKGCAETLDETLIPTISFSGNTACTAFIFAGFLEPIVTFIMNRPFLLLYLFNLIYRILVCSFCKFDKQLFCCCIVSHMNDRSRRDRKSTRLNSSHVASSYAVFCLKKK